MASIPSTRQAEPDTCPSPTVVNVEQQLDRLEEQVNDLRSQLRHAQRMASVGTMAAMVAHEFNNLLTPILSYVPYALQAGDPKLMTTALERILKQVQRAKAICDRLLACPGDAADVTDASLQNVVEEAIEFLVRDLAKDRIDLDVAVPRDLQVRVNAGLIQQVVTNLVMNARQAMADGPGRLSIWIDGAADGWVWLHVRDTGGGIPAEIQERIFQPFVSTKRDVDRQDHRGIGLGLAVCREIVEEHGGQIRFDTRRGEGTTFSFSLPVADTRARRRRSKAQVPSGSSR